METTQLNIKVKRIHAVENKNLKAFADIVINDSILIKNIRLVDGANGLFISMPAEQGKDNNWYEDVRCLTKDVRTQITDEILSVYNNN
ncbi:MAG: SpoVG family protein [Candidatus Omnitrophica bacterium]|nr:SpoVG family protein [Candidatus Omnitrophota bacterium]